MIDYGFSQIGQVFILILRVFIHLGRTTFQVMQAREAKKAAYNGPEDGDGGGPVVDGQPILDQMMTNPGNEFGMTEAIMGTLINTVANVAYKVGARKEIKEVNPEDVNL